MMTLERCEDCGSEHLSAPCGMTWAERMRSLVFDYKPNGHISDTNPGDKSLRRGIGARKAHYGRLEKYASLVRSGVSPNSTQTKDIEQADRLSQKLGRPFDATHDAGYASAENAGVL